MHKAGTLCFTATLLLALPAQADDPPPAAAKIFPYDIHSETLDNGLEVLLVPLPAGGLVAYWTIVRTGARDEYEPGRTGFAHFFEHMMFRGTEKYPAEVYNQILTEIGADANAFTSDDLTAYHLNVAAEDLERVMEIESDRFQNLAYPEEMFRTEAGAVYGEYRKNRTSPFFTAYESIHQAAFEKHTYGHTAMGYEADIQNMPNLFDYSRTFFDRYYRPDNTYLLITGDVDVTKTMELVRRYYGGWKPGYVAPKVPVESPQTSERRITVSFEGSTLPILWLAYKIDAFDPTDRKLMAARLLCELAFGETSELYGRLVLGEQVVEDIEADFNVNRDPGLIDVIAVVKDPAKVDTVLADFDQTLDRYRTEPPDPERLQALVSRLKYSFLMGLDTPAAVAEKLARFIAVTGDVTALEQQFATYAAITPQDVQAAAETYFTRDRRTVAVLQGVKP